ncbi:RNA-directed DNA polymerase, eukaryota [Tanacetum coccineum]
MDSRLGEIIDVDEPESTTLSYKKLCVKVKSHVTINGKVKFIMKGKVFWIQIKELETWVPKFTEVKETTPLLSDEIEEKIRMSKKDPTVNEQAASDKPDDPFGIYKILKRNNDKVASKSVDPQFPSRFTPVVAKVIVTGDAGSTCSSSFKIDGLGHKAKKGWIHELNTKHRVNFVTLHETKLETMNIFSIKALWGYLSFDYVFSPSVGFSGGILCVWDPNLFIKESSTISDYFVAIRGNWVASSTKILIISVYTPQEPTEKRDLWDFLYHMIDSWDGECVLMGDFNEVRTKHERYGTVFNLHGANAFNNFINMTGLVDLLLEGYSYTWSHKSASKMSKLDRFLITEGLLTIFPSLSALCLDRHLSDHRPILLRELNVDYGPIPFRLFHSWFNKNRFVKMVEDSWKDSAITEPNSIISLKKKLQALKTSIKQWITVVKLHSSEAKNSIQNRLAELDKMLDQGRCNDELLNERTNLLKDL